MPKNKVWYQAPLRVVQTVLRLQDAHNYDAKAALDYVRRLHGNVFIVNGGGIYAFYPSGIPLQERAPGLKQDILGEVVEEAKEHGIRVMVRVDFRGSHRHAFEAHPDWFSVDVNGQPIMMYGLHASNPNSPYRNEGYAHQLVREILERYDVDGIWQNSPGFGPTSYDIHSQAAFREATGYEIPTEQNETDPAYRAFLKWRYQAVLKQDQALREVVKSFGEDKAYVAEASALLNVGWTRGAAFDPVLLAPNWDIVTAPTFDILRRSHGSPLYPVPVWGAEESTKLLKAVRPDSSPAILFGPFDNQSRYTTVAGHELKLWLASALAHGGSFWNCTFVGAHDKAFMDRRHQEVIATYYKLLEENEALYTDVQPVADVAVVYSQQTQNRFGADDPNGDDYLQHLRGVELALFEHHIPFDILPQEYLESAHLERYKTVVLPNVALLSNAACEVLRDYVKAGGGLVATYETSLYDETAKRRADYGLSDVLGVQSLGVHYGPMNYAYTLIRERSELTSGLEDTDISTNEGMTWLTKAAEEARVPATLVPEVVPQPPEMGGQDSMETEIPVMVAHEYGRGRAAFFPGQTDKLFVSAGHPDYGLLLRNAALWTLGDAARLIETDAPASVHVSVTRQLHTELLMVHLLNYTGGYRRPITHLAPVANITVLVRVLQTPERIYGLRSGDELAFGMEDGAVRFVVPNVEDYEAIVIGFGTAS